MSGYKFIDGCGSFEMKDPQHTSGLYLPVAGGKGLRSAVSPDFGGDSKLDQNHFLIAPKSVSDLHAERDTRNFWAVFEDGIWSACGASASQDADRFTDREDEVTLSGGRMWQSVTRKSKDRGIQAQVTIFALLDNSSEIMTVKFTNVSDADISFTPVAAVPIYARSADNIRDHRHVTSLLNRAILTDKGVVVKPTLSFDERGHQINDTAYFVIGADESGRNPVGFIADADSFVGEGGTYTRPRSLLDGMKSFQSGPIKVDGKEMIGALKFEEVTLSPGKSASYQIAIGTYVGEKDTEFKEYESKDFEAATEAIKSADNAAKELEKAKAYWENITNIHVKTGDENFDNFMEWIAFQPQLRRIYGCSFLPHHDYGRGGRGWRDLWQDCLALLLTDPDGVRKMILDNFRGVRLDGTNATIIGDKPGEFKADRNGIPRVWMDHGFWPFLTLKLYMDQTGDLDILMEDATYFKDNFVCRAEKRDDSYSEDYGVVQKDDTGKEYMGSVLEHLLIENLTAFYDVGEHGKIRLRGADWNDALDMATHKGESVAFTNGYAGNLQDIADYIRLYESLGGNKTCMLAKEILPLILSDGDELFDSPENKRKLLYGYMDEVKSSISGVKEEIDLEELAAALEEKSQDLMDRIRKTEWVRDSQGDGWFNGYYDDNGNAVEGEFSTPEGKNVRMMLTGQVFSVMAGTATEEDVPKIIRSADKHLYSKEIGGYRLNTDFKALRTDLGRMFGFSYGDKENGAVFSHMAVMFGNALYKRGFAKEGFKALNSLYETASDFETSRIYPGVPEYFNGEGRGLYNYLTGAASWYLMTVVTQEFGVCGAAGDLCIEPKLVASQFSADNEAAISLPFRGKTLEVTYQNPDKKDAGQYVIKSVAIDGKEIEAAGEACAIIGADIIDVLSAGTHKILVVLG
ncbi:cellobiose phosphorylase [Butyrivibrio sp. CB08]|uniref:GH36-type glycosyl hydrolase domain-containing protein n=1 Tax=Butyrivibrio sp. CB08 TaxID=2364879 RepID=UPI000EAA747F|nr:cellobiose phosphorylase [Butyrivibrio sp. CB08]RKM61111.1 cellobiose phosphorylase [Butyrivibrio sp. CB08]